MARFFIAASNIFGGIAYINHDEAEHMKVLRIKGGETFTVCDGNGTDYVCRLSEESPEGEMTAEILEQHPSSGEASIHCAVYSAYPKGDKAETVIQKCVELGVNDICFFPSARCVSKPDEKTILRKTLRWQKIATEAAKQSGRGRIPKVSALPSFSIAVSSACNSQLPLFLNETEHSYGIRAALEENSSARTISIMTGPEGGFEPEEAQFAINEGMKSVTIGPRILRCETAPIAAAAAVMLMTGNMD